MKTKNMLFLMLLSGTIANINSIEVGIGIGRGRRPQTECRLKPGCTKCYCSMKCGLRDAKEGEDCPFNVITREFGTVCFCRKRDAENFEKCVRTEAPEKIAQDIRSTNCCPKSEETVITA